ncbi:MAG: MBL fold metallo-hydrolase [Chloroflexota bacterium]
MKFRLWGTRGSIPAPGPSTIRYGGNTSCIEVRLADDALIILDAGSGIRALGSELGACDATILLTHYHWDHIQGLPFFSSAFDARSSIEVFGPEFDGQGPEENLTTQMMTPYCPATPSQLSGITAFRATPDAAFAIAGSTVTAARVSHPGVTLGYRVEEAGESLTYISDDEVALATPHMLESIVQLARGADLLIHDCQYTGDEYVDRRGWGHSTAAQCVRIAERAGVKRLMLFHHDPSHSDDQVEAIAEEAASLTSIDVVVAREGDTVTVGKRQSHDRERGMVRMDPPLIQRSAG